MWSQTWNMLRYCSARDTLQNFQLKITQQTLAVTVPPSQSWKQTLWMRGLRHQVHDRDQWSKHTWRPNHWWNLSETHENCLTGLHRPSCRQSSTAAHHAVLWRAMAAVNNQQHVLNDCLVLGHICCITVNLEPVQWCSILTRVPQIVFPLDCSIAGHYLFP